MAVSSRHCAAVRSQQTNDVKVPDKPARYRHHERIAAAAGAVLVVIIGVLAGWAHHSLSTARPVLPNTAAISPASASATPLTPSPVRVQLRAWLTQAESSLNALLTARHQIAAAAASKDIAGTRVACLSADGAVASVQQHLPSPELALNTALQQALDGYQLALRYCLAGLQNQDINDVERTATYLDRANTDLQAAVDILERDLSDFESRDPDVMTV